MVRAITFDAFGTLIDTGRDVLIRIARSVCEDQRPSLDAEALLATWDRHFFAAETAPFLTLAEITEDSLEKTFREYGIEATPGPYVDRLVSLWRQAKAYAEVPRILDALDGVPRAVVSNADHEFLLDILERNGLRFDAVITSESAQTYKPRPRIFEDPGARFVRLRRLRRDDRVEPKAVSFEDVQEELVIRVRDDGPRDAIQRIEDSRDFGVRLRLPPQGDEAIDVRGGGRFDAVLAERLLEAVLRDLRQREERGGLRREEVTVPRGEEGFGVEARPLVLAHGAGDTDQHISSRVDEGPERV